MAALDVAVAPALRQTLRRVLADRTVVMVTHDVLDALLLADRVVVLEEGAVVEQGRCSEVLSQPRSAFAARIAGLNMIAGTWRDDAVLTAGRPASRRAGRRTRAPAAGTPSSRCSRPTPSRCSSSRPAAAPATPSRSPITDLEPQSGRIRVRAAALSADITPHAAAELDLAPGCARAVRRQGDRGLRLRDVVLRSICCTWAWYSVSLKPTER